MNGVCLMNKKDINILKNLPLARKMLFVYIFCVILPVMVLSTYYYRESENSLHESEMKDMESAVVKSENAVQSVMDRVVFIGEMIMYDDEIHEILSMNGEGGESLIKAAGTLDDKMLHYITSGFADSIIIYSNNPHLYNSAVHRHYDEIEKEGLLKDGELKKGTYRFLLHKDKRKERKSVVMLVMMRKTKESDKNILRIDLPVSALSQELSKNAIKTSIYLLDDNDKVVAAGLSENESSSIEEGAVFEGKEDETVYCEMNYPSGYRVAARYVSGYSLGAQTLWFILLVLFVLILATVIIYLVTKSLTNKIDTLTECTRKIQNGVFETVDESNAGKDEIGFLLLGINEAVRKINSLINEVYAERIKNAEAEKARYRTELAELRARVNPHFMFNVLEVMRMKVIKRGDKELAGVIKEVSKIFRLLITRNSDIITLEEEMKFVDAFLRIQPYSIDDEAIDIKVNVDDEALGCLIPKMSVQVFVENAFLHGLESISENRSFRLAVSVHGERLDIEIEDNGCGMGAETLRMVTDKEEPEENKIGTGIRTALSRFDMYYDGDYTADIFSEEGKGTRIRISLPVKY